MARIAETRGRKTLLLSLGALGLVVFGVPLGLYSVAYSAAFPFGKGLVCGPSFKGSASRGTMAVAVDGYRAVCADTSGDPQRVMTFHRESLRQPGVTASARGYRAQSWYGWLLFEDTAAPRP
jgi:hypothetical protein